MRMAGETIREGGPTRERRIAHLDMDAFYASVELLRRPDLRGQPVIVGGRRDAGQGAHYRGRGVVTTASYEARAFGVRSGMSLMRALTLCPGAVRLPTDFDEYRRVSRLFKRAIGQIAPVIEDRGVDEVYFDLTDVAGSEIDGGAAVAREVKHEVYAATSLTCSIGIAPNKLLAKIASELAKPDGITVVEMADVPARIWPLQVTRVNGIGPKAAERLARLGVATIGELAAVPQERLVGTFGPTYGAWMHAIAFGHDDRPIVTSRPALSRSRETTFERDLHPVRDRASIDEHLVALCRRVAEDLVRHADRGRTIGLKVRFEDFSTVTRDLTLPAAVQDAPEIERAVRECLARIRLHRRIRLLGVRVGGLQGSAPSAAPPPATLSLF
jgi:DNA polymerase IV